MNLTIKPCPELTDLSKITGLTEYDLSNKIIHILDVELHCIEHWTTDAGKTVFDLLCENNETLEGFNEDNIKMFNSLPIESTDENHCIILFLTIWGTGEHPCEICGCEVERDHTEDLEFCLNPECGYKNSYDHTDYDEKRKLRHDNN